MSKDAISNEEIVRLNLKYNKARKQRHELQAKHNRMKQQELADAEELNRLEEEIVTQNVALQKSVTELAELQCLQTKVGVWGEMERVRTESRLVSIQEKKKQFDDLFATETRSAEQRYRQQRERERGELEREREAAAAVEAECDQLERDCAVLKKRNKAMLLLLLRKSLLDAEARRRNLGQHHPPPPPPAFY